MGWGAIIRKFIPAIRRSLIYSGDIPLSIPSQPMSANPNLKQILSGDSQALLKVIELTAKVAKHTPETRRQAIAEQLLEQLWQDCQADPALQPLLSQLTPVLSQWIARDDSFYLKADHPLRSQMEQFISHITHWYPRDSKPSQQFLDKLKECITHLTNNNKAEKFDEFIHWADAEAKRARMLADRLGDSEAGQMRLLAIECQAIDVLNEHLAGKPFPTESAEGITRVLKSELQHSLFIAGDNPDNSPFWKQWTRMLPVLGQVFSSKTIKVEDAVLYGQIPPLVNELERSLQLPQSNPTAYHPWIDQLCQMLMAAIQKKNPDTCEIATLPYPEGYSNNNTRVTQALLQQSQSLQPGDWLRFSDDQGSVIRCMLAYKSPDAHQLILVDQAGRKVMNKSLKDMALCLSTGVATPLKNPNIKQRVEQLLGKLVSLAQKVQEQQQVVAEARAQKAAAELVIKQQEAVAAAERAAREELDVRRNAARKAFSEAKALAEEKQKRAEENTKLQQEAADSAEAKLIAAQAEVSDLKVGAWMELVQPDGSAQKCKLSVILGGTGKYIFVDQLGRKFAEFQRDQLIELMQKDGLRLLRQGGDFEDQLAKVIRGLRKDISS